MNHNVKLKFESSETKVSAFCPTCILSIPFESLTCGVEIDLDSACESNQCEIQMHHVFPYEVGEDPHTTFMGMRCPYCGGIMTMIDTEIAPFIKYFNKVKLFTQYSCEGHRYAGTDPITKLDDFSINQPYIKFIGNGKTLRDILIYNLIIKNRCQLEQVRDHEWSISSMFGGNNLNKLSALIWDTQHDAIYTRQAESFSQEDFDTMRMHFNEAMYILCYNLPDFIRTWYAECKDDSTYFSDTLKKKERYLNAWEDGMTLRSVIAGEPYMEDNCHV